MEAISSQQECRAGWLTSDLEVWSLRQHRGKPDCEEVDSRLWSWCPFIPSTQEADKGSVVRGQPRLHSFRTARVHSETVLPYLMDLKSFYMHMITPTVPDRLPISDKSLFHYSYHAQLCPTMPGFMWCWVLNCRSLTMKPVCHLPGTHDAHYSTATVAGFIGPKCIARWLTVSV